MATPLVRPPTAWSVPAIVARLADGGPCLVALSGGVDSAVVAALAHAALGRDAHAVTLTGPAVSSAESERARRVAAAIGIDHTSLPVDPLARAEYRANGSNRCFFCRAVEAERLLAHGAVLGVAQYLDGVHLDDLSDDRPGLAAMEAAGFRHPLVEAGWTKTDVRREARARGLPNAEQPSDACLASRVPHGQPIDAALLGRIEAAERAVLAAGFRRVRVRVRGAGARIVVDPDELPRLEDAELRSRLGRTLASLGFRPVEFDPDGYGARGGRP